MDERRNRTAWVGERFEIEDAGRLTGLFDVHWEALDGEELGDGPQGVAVDEAVAWGREHASFVSVRLGGSDTFYSAGELDLNDLPASDEEDDEPYLPWPAEGMVVRSRPMGAPPDGSVQEVDWRIHATGTVSPDPEDLARLRALLEADARLRDVELTSSREGVRMRCVIRARGTHPAVLQTDHIFHEALIRVFPEHDSTGDSAGSLGPVSPAP